MTEIQYAKFNDGVYPYGGTGAANYPSTTIGFSANYVAVGFFQGSNGLPADGTAINDVASFDAYVQALEAKEDQISDTYMSVAISSYIHYVGLGGNGSDFLNAYGSFGTGLLEGRDGNDVLDGGFGADTLEPGAGFDQIDGGGDLFHTHALNTVSFADVTQFLYSTGVKLDLTDAQRPINDGVGLLVFRDIQNITGSIRADILTGDISANVIDGDGGDDILSGGGGDDTVSYASAGQGVQVSLALQDITQMTGDGRQTLRGFRDLTGSLFGDTLSGDSSANRIDGGAGSDTLVGGGGDDTLFSDGAGDKLLGGGGHDTFQFTGFTNADLGTVSTLASGDLVDLTGAASSLSLQHFTAVSHFDGLAGEVLARHLALHDRTVFLFDVDGDGVHDHKLVVRGPDSSDYSLFLGVDTSAIAGGAAHDSGSLVN